MQGMNKHTLTALLLLTVTLVTLPGCGDPLNRQAVSGTVTFHGKPVVIGSVTFVPIPETGPTTGGAQVKAGKFEVLKAQGLAPGKYNVRFTAFDREVAGPTVPGSGPTPEPAKDILPAKHGSDSKQEVEVKAGGPNVFEFKLD